MLHLVETQRVYYPETLAAMAAVFDQVCQWLRSVNSDDEARRQLAMIIIRFVDQGEHDPEWLAKYAFCETIVLGGLLSSARFAEIREAQATRHTQCDFDIDDCAARFSEA